MPGPRSRSRRAAPTSWPRPRRRSGRGGGREVRWQALRVEDRPAVARFLAACAPFDHLVLPGSTVKPILYDDLTDGNAREVLREQVLGAVLGRLRRQAAPPPGRQRRVLHRGRGQAPGQGLHHGRLHQRRAQCGDALAGARVRQARRARQHDSAGLVRHAAQRHPPRPRQGGALRHAREAPAGRADRPRRGLRARRHVPDVPTATSPRRCSASTAARRSWTSARRPGASRAPPRWRRGHRSLGQTRWGSTTQPHPASLDRARAPERAGEACRSSSTRRPPPV